MRNIWIVVADAGRALILSKREGIAQLKIVGQIENPLGRAHNVDLVSDQPGRLSKHRSGVKSAMAAPTEPHEHQLKEFSHQVNHFLDEAACRGDFDLLVLVAPSHFLGLLRLSMRPAPRGRLIHRLANDFTRLTVEELQLRLAPMLECAFAEAGSI